MSAQGKPPGPGDEIGTSETVAAGSADELGTSETMAAGSAGELETGATMAATPADAIGSSATVAAGSADALATGATLTADADDRASPRSARVRASASSKSTAGQAVPDGLQFVPPDSYEVLSEYGRGGLGRILRARDRRTGRIVAIKEMLPDAAHAAARFQREALITANLQHPAIVPVYEVGLWQDARPFYAMKLVTGRDLHAVIKTTNGLHERLALLPHVIAVAEALAYAHSERIIHRDLKPANVLVGDYGETVVIDWGLAKDLSAAEKDDLPATPYRATDGALTQAGAIVGTPAYMPPEQARGDEVDERADVYAIGAMLYHLLSGRPPYADSKSLEELLSRVLAGPPQRIDERTADAPPDLLAIVDKAMAHDRNDRYATARELAEDLNRFQTGKLVAAHAYTAWQLLRRWVGRHRAAVAVAAIAAVVLAGVAVVGVLRIRAERDTARAERARAETASADAMRRLGALYAEQGRRALEDHDANRAAALLAEAYALGNDQASTRMLLARAMKGVEARAEAVVVPGEDPGWFYLAFSPTGSQLVTAGAADQAVLWDPTTGLALARFQTPGGANGISYSPDGKRIVLMDRRGRAHLIDAERKSELWTSEPLDEYPSLLAAFAPDSRSFALALRNKGQALVFDAAAGGPPRLIIPHAGVLSVAYDEEGARLVTASPDGGVAVWDSGTGKQLRVLGDASDGVVKVRSLRGGRVLAHGRQGVVSWNLATGEREHAFSVDRELLMGMAVDDADQILFAWGTSGTVFVWSIRTGQPLGELEGHQDLVEAGVFDESSGTLTTVGRDGALLCWDLIAQSPVFELGGLSDNSEALALHPGAARVAFSDRDDAVRIVDYGAHKRFIPVEGASIKTESLAFAPDGARAIIGSLAPAVSVIDADTGARVRELAVPPPGPVYAVYSSDGSRIAAANGADVVVVFDSDGDEPVATISGAGSTMAIAPDGSAVAAGRADGEVRLFDADSGKARRSKKVCDTAVSTVEYSPDGTQILVGCDDGKGALLAAATGEVTAVPPHDERLRGARFAPDGSFVITVGLNEPMHVVDTATGELRRTIGDTVLSLALSPDGTRVASGHMQGDVGVWNVATGERMTWFPVGSRPVVVLRFAADGQRLLTTQLDGEVAVWNASSGTRLLQLDGHRGQIVRARFSPDGSRALVIGDLETRARLWDVHLESRSPADVAAITRCDSGWFAADGALVPGRAPDCR